MDLMARRFAMLAQQKSVPTEYITDGLVLWLDGLDRGGISGQWADKVSNNICILAGNYTENENNVYFPGTLPAGHGEFSDAVVVSKDVGTIEFAVRLIEFTSTGRPVISFGVNNIGGSIASGTSGSEVAARWYGSNTSNMGVYKFPAEAQSLNLVVSANSDLAICNGFDGVARTTTPWEMASGIKMLASRNRGNPFKGSIYSVRIYNRKLSKDEMIQNQQRDNLRYGLGLSYHS